MTPYHCAHIKCEYRRDGMKRVGFYRVASGFELFVVPAVEDEGHIGVSPHLPEIAGRCVDCGAEYGWRLQEVEA